jgi:FG-GAP-like repeat
LNSRLPAMWGGAFFVVALAVPVFAQPVSFASPAVFPVGQLPAAVATADFNHDGHADLAGTNNSGVSILLGKGDGTFRNLAGYVTGYNPSAIAVADFNGDGNLDLAVGNGGGKSVAILLGNGDGTFQAPGISPPVSSRSPWRQPTSTATAPWIWPSPTETTTPSPFC